MASSHPLIHLSRSAHRIGVSSLPYWVAGPRWMGGRSYTSLARKEKEREATLIGPSGARGACGSGGGRRLGDGGAATIRRVRRPAHARGCATWQLREDNCY